ncbi:hypothetical protein Pelo_19892 [Pelomyxa schiedti]|nr:hypothetical protein Pelo_19892 [Pelomyxa schiedti]
MTAVNNVRSAAIVVNIGSSYQGNMHAYKMPGFPTVLCMEWDLLCGVMRKEGAGKPSHRTNMPLQKKVDNNQVPLGATARITAK